MNETVSICCLCSRPLGTVNVEQHHLIPKTHKGKDTVPLHKMCHQKVHSIFTEKQLQKYYHTPSRLLEHEEIQKFVTWISKKLPEYYDKNNDTKGRKSRRNN